MSDISLDETFDRVLAALGEEHADELRALRREVQAVEIPIEMLVEKESEDRDSVKGGDIFTIIKSLAVPFRIKLAMFGNLSARKVLIRDANLQVALFVLENPRITENEILEIARNQNLDENILRGVSANSTWTRSYAVKAALVANPRVPANVALRWVKFLKESDLAKLAKSKNIPQVVATQCRKALEQKRAAGK